MLKTILAIFVGLFIFIAFASHRAAANLCKNHPVGSPMTNIEDLEGTLFLTRMGPHPNFDQPGVRDVMFCASLSMCDTSCSFKVRDGLVIEATFTAV
jgi:hypothetical protein